MIHLEVIVADTEELLDPIAYGVGALLRWESSATIDGVYVEGGTVALVSGTTVYDIWDGAGTVGTWYRTRISNSGGTSFSSYTIPFQTSEQGLYLSVSQLRAFNVGGTLGDEPLLTFLNAATQDIRRTMGPMGPITEILRASSDALWLSREPLSILTVSEMWGGAIVALADDDWSLNDQVLYRLNTGTNRTWNGCWRGRVAVAYQPQDDLATRQRGQLALVKLDITYSPGLASQAIGQWSESYRVDQYTQERDAILASLSGGVLIK